jgi:hypothetical protein
MSADMPQAIWPEWREAEQILQDSPRGSAALLRLAVQKLLPVLGAKPDDINKMIGELVASGTISKTLQQALDVLRVIGNEAVHPGTIDLNDDRPTAVSLFSLINVIVEKAITEPRQVDELYAKLPPGKLEGIQQRDKKRDGGEQ